MRDLTESNVTDAVLNVIADDTNPRLKEIMEALIRHSHDFIREVNLSPDELLYAARFIQMWAIYPMTSGKRVCCWAMFLGMTASGGNPWGP